MLLVGLGNLGEKYRFTRHNIGFMVVDEFARKNGFPEFTLNKKSNSLVSEAMFSGQKTVLAKPQTFMNDSGFAVKSLYTKYKIQDTRYIVVIHDDIDLPLGTIKVSTNRGSAGHKGVESIIDALGTKNFTRIRVGIQPAAVKPENVESFVLEKFAKEEQKTLELAVQNALEALETTLTAESK